MGVQQEKAAMISGPILATQNQTTGALIADTSGMTGVMRIAVTTSSLSFAFPQPDADNKNPQKKVNAGKRFIRLAATDASAASPCNPQYVQYRGPTAPTLVYNQVSVAGTGSVAAGATLFSGVPEHIEIDPYATGIAFIGAAAGFLEWYVSDGAGRP